MSKQATKRMKETTNKKIKNRIEEIHNSTENIALGAKLNSCFERD